MIKNHLGFHYAMNQQKMPWHIYLQQDSQGRLFQRDLQLTNHHFVSLDHEAHFHNDWRSKFSVYAQYSDKILSYQGDNSVFILENIALLNYQEQMPALQNQGNAIRWGAAWSLEKFWSDGWLAKLNATYGDGFYFINQQRYNGRYIHLYNLNVQLTKEFAFGRKRQTGLVFSTNFQLGDGFRYTPINLEASIEDGTERLNNENYLSAKTPIHWRWDTRIGLRVHGDNVKHSFWVECNNILDRQNISAYYYSPNTTTIDAWTGLGRVFNFSYKVIIEPKRIRQ